MYQKITQNLLNVFKCANSFHNLLCLLFDGRFSPGYAQNKVTYIKMTESVRRLIMGSGTYLVSEKKIKILKCIHVYTHSRVLHLSLEYDGPTSFLQV